MTPRQRKEELSRAWLCAVAGSCGYAIGSWSQDQDCIDATISAADPVGAGVIADTKIDVQLKATSARIGDGWIDVQLSKDKLVKLTRRSMAPKILVALALPDVDEVEVVEHQHLLLRRCAYYLSTSAIDAKAEGESKVVRVPFSQPFTPIALQAMMERVSKGEVL